MNCFPQLLNPGSLGTSPKPTLYLYILSQWKNNMTLDSFPAEQLASEGCYGSAGISLLQEESKMHSSPILYKVGKIHNRLMTVRIQF